MKLFLTQPPQWIRSVVRGERRSLTLLSWSCISSLLGWGRMSSGSSHWKILIRNSSSMWILWQWSSSSSLRSCKTIPSTRTESVCWCRISTKSTSLSMRGRCPSVYVRVIASLANTKSARCVPIFTISRLIRWRWQYSRVRAANTAWLAKISPSKNTTR